MKIKYILSPHFLEKKGILDSISKVLDVLGKNYKILDVGCGSQPYRKLFEDKGAKYTGIDFGDYSKNNSFKKAEPDLFFPEGYTKDFNIPLEDKSFNVILAFQVLEHHKNIEKFFSEANRLLKEDGYLFITFPFIWSLHEEPNDFQRLTHYKIKDLAERNGLEIVNIDKRGGVSSVISQTLNLSLFEKKIPKIIKYFLYFLLLAPFQYFSYLFEKLIKQKEERTIFLGYSILMQKK